MTLAEIYNQPLEKDEEERATEARSTLLRVLPSIKEENSTFEDVDWTETGALLAKVFNAYIVKDENAKTDLGIFALKQIKTLLSAQVDSKDRKIPLSVLKSFMDQVIIPPSIAGILFGLMR